METNVLPQARTLTTPDWLIGEMPQGYQTRISEIQRLRAELDAMNRIGRLMWETGPPLAEAIVETFAALKFDVEPSGHAATYEAVVKLDSNRRLLINVAASEATVQKKSPELARVFQTLHEFAGEHDRVVFVVNGDRTKRPGVRPEPVGPDALNFLRRMGVNVVGGPSLFKLWLMALQEPERVRMYLDRLHAQDGGAFELA